MPAFEEKADPHISSNNNTKDSKPTKSAPTGPNVPAAILWSHIGLGILSMIFAVYVCITLVFVEIKRRSRVSRKNISPSERNLSIASRVTCIGAAALSLAASIFSVLEVLANNYEYFGLNVLHNQSTCNSIIGSWFLLAGTTCVYAFLWIRQRVFYVNPALKDLGGFTLQSISYVVIFAWAGYFFYGSVTVFAYFRMTYIPGVGCRLPSSSGPIAWRFFLSWALACSSMEACLLALFVYPLMKRQCFGHAALSTSSGALYQRVVKATCLTVACIATDILSYLSFYVFSGGTFPIYTTNLSINVCMIILCFDFWKEVLIPCNISCCADFSDGRPEKHVNTDTRETSFYNVSSSRTTTSAP